MYFKLLSINKQAYHCFTFCFLCFFKCVAFFLAVFEENVHLLVILLFKCKKTFYISFLNLKFFKKIETF